MIVQVIGPGKNAVRHQETYEDGTSEEIILAHLEQKKKHFGKHAGGWLFDHTDTVVAIGRVEGKTFVPELTIRGPQPAAAK